MIFLIVDVFSSSKLVLKWIVSVLRCSELGSLCCALVLYCWELFDTDVTQ